MNAGVHHVRRQRWSVRVPSEPQALAVRSWLRDRCDSELKEALAAAFDRLAPGAAIVRLSRLEVNIRVSGVEELAEVLPSCVSEALIARLEENVNRAEPTIGRGSREHARASLIDYLLTGSVAWPARPDEPLTLATLASEARSAPEQIAALLARRAPSPQVLADAMFRLLQFVDDAVWQVVMESAIKSLGGSATARLEQVAALLKRPVSLAKDRRLRLVVSRLTDRSGDAVSTSPHDLNGGQEQAAPTSTSNADEAASQDGAAAGRSRESWSHRARLIESARDDADNAAASTRPHERLRLMEQLVNLGILNAPPARRSAVDEIPETGFAVAVANAGLVLLHPFLPSFFRSTGFGDVRDWDASALETARAAALLHFVATGRDEPFELELGFIKILLGLDPATPLVVSAGLLTDADREEAHAMVQAAIGHWNALKRTSVDAVRTSFLQRSGLVKRDENGWRLQLEASPFDVLIKRLPWSLTVVKLPWMRLPIHCE